MQRKIPVVSANGTSNGSRHEAHAAFEAPELRRNWKYEMHVAEFGPAPQAARASWSVLAEHAFCATGRGVVVPCGHPA